MKVDHGKNSLPNLELLGEIKTHGAKRPAKHKARGQITKLANLRWETGLTRQMTGCRSLKNLNKTAPKELRRKIKFFKSLIGRTQILDRKQLNTLSQRQRKLFPSLTQSTAKFMQKLNY